MYHMYGYQRVHNHEGAKHSHVIQVRAEHTEYLSPNQAIVTLGVVTQNMELSVAQQENNSTSQRIIQAILQQGIPEQQIQTLNYQVYPQYNYENGKQVFTGYEVRQLFQITINVIDKIGNVIDAAIASGANIVQNINFKHSQTQQTYKLALVKAYEKAFEKAQVLAKASRQQLFPQPKKIVESSEPTPSPMQFTTMVKSSETPTEVQPGQIGVTADIFVEFMSVP